MIQPLAQQQQQKQRTLPYKNGGRWNSLCDWLPNQIIIIIQTDIAPKCRQTDERSIDVLHIPVKTDVINKMAKVSFSYILKLNNASHHQSPSFISLLLLIIIVQRSSFLQTFSSSSFFFKFQYFSPEKKKNANEYFSLGLFFKKRKKQLNFFWLRPPGCICRVPTHDVHETKQNKKDWNSFPKSWNSAVRWPMGEINRTGTPIIPKV